MGFRLRFWDERFSDVRQSCQNDRCQLSEDLGHRPPFHLDLLRTQNPKVENAPGSGVGEVWAHGGHCEVCEGQVFEIGQI